MKDSMRQFLSRRVWDDTRRKIRTRLSELSGAFGSVYKCVSASDKGQIANEVQDGSWVMGVEWEVGGSVEREGVKEWL